MFKVVSTAGDTFLGGEDFDTRIIDWLVQGFQEEHGIDLRKDRMALQRLKDAAEKAKCELSSVAETEVNLPFIISSARNEALHLQRILTRDKLEELTSRPRRPHRRDLREDARRGGHREGRDRGRDPRRRHDAHAARCRSAVARVLRARAVQGRAPRRGRRARRRDPGRGARRRDSSDMLLLDVTPHTLGIMIVGGYFEELIAQNTTVPTSRSKIFTTVRDNQTAVKILVLQGESRRAEENELLGEFILTGLRRAPAGEVEVEVTFEINADGIVSVHAKDLETGQEQSITVTATSGLTAGRDREDDRGGQGLRASLAVQSEEFEAAKQQAEKLIAEIEKLFPEVEKVVAGSDFGRDAIDKARGVVERARSLIERGDAEALQEQIDALARTQRMFKGVVGKAG